GEGRGEGGCLNRIGPQAARADPRAKRLAVHRHATHLQVGQKPPVDPVLRVADVMSELRRFTADCALPGHGAPSGWSSKEARNDDPEARARTRIVPWVFEWPPRPPPRSSSLGSGGASKSSLPRSPPSPGTPRS